MPGIDGERRQERPERPDGHRFPWLDEIAGVEHTDSTPGSESRARSRATSASG